MSRLTPRACSSARWTRVRSPGERSEQARDTCSAPRPNFASRRARFDTREARSRDELVDECGVAGERRTVLPDRADHRAKGDAPLPGDQRHLAEQHAEECRLPGSVGADDRQPLAGNQIEIDRAELEVPAPTDCPIQAQDVLRKTRAGAEREPQLPRLERLLRKLVALEQTLRLSHLRLERVRRTPVRTSGLVPEGIALCARFRPPRRQELRELLPTGPGLLVLGDERQPLRITRSGVVAPPSGPLAQPMRSRLDRSDPPDGAVEQLAVVRNENERAPIRAEERLEPREPVVVEIVRRLVQEEDVEAREEDRRKLDARGLATRECGPVSIEVDVEPEVGTNGSRPRLEVAAAQRDECVQRSRVALFGSLTAGKRGR